MEIKLGEREVLWKLERLASANTHLYETVFVSSERVFIPVN